MKQINIWEWFKKDKWIILLLVFALLSNVYTMKSVEKHQVECNQHCINYIDRCQCQCGFNNNVYNNFTKEYNINNLIVGGANESTS